jgi:phosphoribosylanthranilate isomerase
VFVKICGVSTQQGVAAAVDAGADAVGFVLTRSPRQVDPRAVRSLVSGMPARVLSVGVFAGLPVEEVARAAASAGVGAVQLHGSHSRGDWRRLAELRLRMIRAAAPGAELRCGALGEDMLVVDSPTPGSGITWDWHGLPERPAGRWLLAGGLHPGNVADAVACLRPWGVDVSSGVERVRGIKDRGLISEFVFAARGAGEVAHAA